MGGLQMITTWLGEVVRVLAAQTPVNEMNFKGAWVSE